MVSIKDEYVAIADKSLSSQFVKCGFAGSNFPDHIFPALIGRPMIRSSTKVGNYEIKVKPVLNWELTYILKVSFLHLRAVVYYIIRPVQTEYYWILLVFIIGSFISPSNYWRTFAFSCILSKDQTPFQGF